MNFGEGQDSAPGGVLAQLRTEPDYSNAKYWFHRVGRHRCFEDIADAAYAILDLTFYEHDKPAPPLIKRNGQWDPFAFVDACEEANRAEADADLIKALRQIQGVELTILLEEFLKA